MWRLGHTAGTAVEIHEAHARTGHGVRAQSGTRHLQISSETAAELQRTNAAGPGGAYGDAREVKGLHCSGEGPEFGSQYPRQVAPDHL